MTKFKCIQLISLLFFSSTVFSSNIHVEKVSDQVHILSGKEYGTNIGLITTENGLTLIDPMPGGGHLLELDNIVKSISNKSIIYILNTHTHSDHTGGNEFFIEQGAKLVESITTSDNLVHIKVKSHSSNDNIYYHKISNTIFVGDVFDTSWHPTFYAGGFQGFNDAIDAIMKLGDEESLIVPGHGAPARKLSLLEFRKNTSEWIMRVRELHQKGWDEDRIMNDAQAKSIVEKFNLGGRSPFLPQEAFKRFVERTISVIEKEKGM